MPNTGIGVQTSKGSGGMHTLGAPYGRHPLECLPKPQAGGSGTAGKREECEMCPLSPSSVVAHMRPFWQLFSACSPAASLCSLVLYYGCLKGLVGVSLLV